MGYIAEIRSWDNDTKFESIMDMPDLETARHNMVESQIRPNDVTDRRLIDAVSQIPREQFVPASMKDLAYMDEEIVFNAASKADARRFMLTPMTFAKLVQAAEVKSTDIVLDVGCATGYSTAILARLAESVVGLESETGLVDRANGLLSELEIDNAAIVAGPLTEGYAGEGPYDVIIVNGAVAELSDKLKEQLKDQGKLVTLLVEGPVSRCHIFRNENGILTGRPLFDIPASRLAEFDSEPEFEF